MDGGGTQWSQRRSIMLDHASITQPWPVTGGSHHGTAWGNRVLLVCGVCFFLSFFLSFFLFFFLTFRHHARVLIYISIYIITRHSVYSWPSSRCTWCWSTIVPSRSAEIRIHESRPTPGVEGTKRLVNHLKAKEGTPPLIPLMMWAAAVSVFFLWWFLIFFLIFFFFFPPPALRPSYLCRTMISVGGCYLWKRKTGKIKER